MSVNALAEGVREGKELICGESLVTASVAIATEFETIDAVVVTQKRATAVGDDSSNFTYGVADNVVTIYAWKPTSGADPTLVAGTTETTVGYVIIGRS